MIPEEENISADTPETSEKKRHYGKGRVLDEGLNQNLIDMAIEYRVWDMSMVFAKFPTVSKSELRKRAAILVEEGLWQEIDSIEEDLRNNKLRVLLPFIRRQVGPKFKCFGPGYQLTRCQK